MRNATPLVRPHVGTGVYHILGQFSRTATHYVTLWCPFWSPSTSRGSIQAWVFYYCDHPIPGVNHGYTMIARTFRYIIISDMGALSFLGSAAYSPFVWLYFVSLSADKLMGLYVVGWQAFLRVCICSMCAARTCRNSSHLGSLRGSDN